MARSFLHPSTRRTMTSFTVHCTHCDTAFPVDPEKVPDGGVRARCTRCEGIFFVAKPAHVAPAAPVEDVDVPSAQEPSAREPEVAADPHVVPAPVTPSPVEPEPDDAGFGSFDDEIEVAAPAPSTYASDEPATLADESVQGSPDVEDAPPEVDEALPHVEDALADVDDALADVEDAVVEPEDALPGPEGAPAVVEAPAPVTQAPTRDLEEELPTVPTGFQFGKRDPHEKARRLARVLVSDMITYNADRHSQALARGTLAEDFEDEIGRSWEEYVDQVGADFAESTPYWTDALNEVLANGAEIF
jgi:predicted Zn finger-like uncharacterized protein